MRPDQRTSSGAQSCRRPIAARTGGRPRPGASGRGPSSGRWGRWAPTTRSSRSRRRAVGAHDGRVGMVAGQHRIGEGPGVGGDGRGGEREHGDHERSRRRSVVIGVERGRSVLAATVTDAVRGRSAPARSGGSGAWPWWWRRPHPRSGIAIRARARRGGGSSSQRRSPPSSPWPRCCACAGSRRPTGSTRESRWDLVTPAGRDPRRPAPGRVAAAVLPAPARVDGALRLGPERDPRAVAGLAIACVPAAWWWCRPSGRSPASWPAG